MKTKKRKLNPKAMPLEMLKRRYFDWLVAEGMRRQKVRKFHERSVMTKQVLAVSKAQYRGHDLVETERDGRVCVELWFQGREYLFDSLSEATSFLDAAAAVMGRVVILSDV